MSAMADVRYRYRLRVSGPQAALLQAMFDACRFAWNQALGRWEDLWRQEGVSLGYAAADRELTDRRSRFEWLAEQPSIPQQQVLRDLYRAIAAFFDKTNPTGRPRFKSRKVGYATARWTKRGFKVSGSGSGSPRDRLEVATGTGRIRLRVVWSRPLPSPPTSVTVYRDAVGRWWASFVVRIEVPAQPLPKTGRVTGLDLGLDTFATVCRAKAKPRLELSDRVFRCPACGLVLERDRNAARNLHPYHPRNHRLGCTGAGDDGGRTPVPAGTEAA